jgi:hypothetical protein
MKKLFAVCVLPLLTLTACGNIPNILLNPIPGDKASNIPEDKDTKQPLNIVELKHPNVTFIFPSGKKYPPGEVFPPPKTIDCSKLTLETDSFEDAIEAGALVVRIQTPRKVTYTVKNEKGEDIEKVVNIKSVYGGVLALCNVSDRAKGPDSRSYRIRGLDEYLVKGKDGFISVVAAVLKNLGPRNYSWMLWLTDRTATFTDYEAEMSRRKASTFP